MTIQTARIWIPHLHEDEPIRDHGKDSSLCKLAAPQALGVHFSFPPETGKHKLPFSGRLFTRAEQGRAGQGRVEQRRAVERDRGLPRGPSRSPALS